MPPTPPSDTGWHLDKRVPIAIILTISLQTIGVVIWASKLDSRVATLEQWVGANVATDKRLSVIESRIGTMGDDLNYIRRALERSAHQ